MFLIDAHLDISTNAVEYNRDYRQPVHDIRVFPATKALC
jgi:membrane dipeptidase